MAKNLITFTIDLNNIQYEKAAQQVIKSTEKIAATTQTTGQKMSAGLNNIKLGWLAIAGAVMGAIRAVSGFVAAAAQEARSVLILNNALSKVGLSAKTVGAEIDALSKKTAVDDDRIRMMYSYGVAIGVPADKLKQFAETSLDYAASTGKSLEMSMRMVGNAAKKGGDEFDRISNSVRGAAEASADADGGLQRLGVAWGEFSESAGAVILSTIGPAIKLITNWLNSIATWLNDFNKSHTGAVKQRLETEIQMLKNSIDKYENGKTDKSGLLAKADYEAKKQRLADLMTEYDKLNSKEVARLNINTDINTALGDQNKNLKKQEDQLRSISDVYGRFPSYVPRGAFTNSATETGGTSSAPSGGAPSGFSGDQYDMSWFNDASDRLTQRMEEQADALEEENRRRKELADSIKAEQDRLDEKMRQDIQNIKDEKLRDLQEKKRLLTSKQFSDYISKKIEETNAEYARIENIRSILGNVPLVTSLTQSADERMRNLQYERALQDTSGAALAALFGIPNAADRGMSTQDILTYLQNELLSGTNKSPFIEYLDDAIIALQGLTESVDENNDLLKKQVDQIKTDIGLGILDVENVRDIRTITESLAAQGLSGTSLLSSLSDVGISGRELSRTGVYGQQIFNFNQVTPDQSAAAASVAASADVGG